MCPWSKQCCDGRTCYQHSGQPRGSFRHSLPPIYGRLNGRPSCLQGCRCGYRVDAELGASMCSGILLRTVSTVRMSIDFPSPACRAGRERSDWPTSPRQSPSRRSLEARRMKFSAQILGVLGIAEGSIPLVVIDHRTVRHGWSQPDLPISEQKGRPWPRGAPSASAP
jgi:hypothetical protein